VSKQPNLRMHHVGVQTADLDNCLRWYVAFFDGKQVWELDHFSPLTRSRLPGIQRLTEVAAGSVRFHLFDRSSHSGAHADANGFIFQHVCLAVDVPEALRRFRERWYELRRSGEYTFVSAEEPTEIVIDADGMQSLYLHDVNGLEYEIAYVPSEAR